MTKLLRRSFTAMAATAGAGMIFSPSVIRRAHAAQTLTIASLFGPDKPETKIWHKIRDLIDAELPGEFNFNIVQNAALGGEKEVAEGVRLGSVQGGLSTISALSGWVPETQILDMPFLFRDAAHLKAVTDGDLGSELKAKLAEQNFAVTGFINYGARHLLAKEAVTTPDQLKGKRIRVIQSPLHTELWGSFGANPTAIPIPETYNALSTGVVDMMDLTKSAYAGFKLYEVVPYLTETAHIWAAGVVYYSAPFWASLTDAQKVVFEKAGAEGSVYFNQLIVDDEVASMKIAADAGGKVVQPADRSAWEAGAQKVWNSFADKVGGIDKIEAIRKLGA